MTTPNSTDVITSNQVSSMVNAYQAAKLQMGVVAENITKLNDICSSLGNEHAVRTWLREDNFDLCDSERTERTCEAFATTLKQSAWKMAISHLGIDRYLTHSVRKLFNQHVQAQTEYDFTEENIYEAVKLLVSNHKTVLDECLAEVFKYLTNAYAVKNWKSNSPGKVNKKVILNCISNYGGIDYHSKDRINDIDRVLCCLSGLKYENVNKICDAVSSYSYDDTESEFFFIKIFKTGTMHLRFKDEKLLEKLNLEASRFFTGQISY